MVLGNIFPALGTVANIFGATFLGRYILEYHYYCVE